MRAPSPGVSYRTCPLLVLKYAAMKLLSRTLSRGLPLLLAFAPTLAAQSQEDLQAKFEEKLSHDFVSFGGWTTDYDAARARAKQEGKVLFVYFSRSYAP